jgi:hypothetical protein
MTGAGRLRRTVSAVLVWALIVAAIGTLLALRGDHGSPTATAPATSRGTATATTATPAPAVHPAPEPAGATPPTAVAPALVAQEPSDATDAPTVADAPSAGPPTTVGGQVGAPAVSASCRPDLALSASPDAPFSFLCMAGAKPLSWPNNTIRLFSSNLTPAQNVALPLALAQWQSQAHFDVTLVTSATAANVVLTSAALSNDEDGYTSMHYVCEATCSYDHADVRLTSTAQLTKTSWIATILHELGHVAGLNHVARHSEVMYPEIDPNAPVAYGSGDVSGFRALEAVRTG